MASIHGTVGIRWGTGGVASSALSNVLMQSYDVERTGDEKEIANGAGEVVTWYGYNAKEEATFTYYIGSGTVNASASFNPPAFGDLITVTTSTNPSLATGSAWIVKSASENATNTDATKGTVKCTEYPLITT